MQSYVQKESVKRKKMRVCVHMLQALYKINLFTKAFFTERRIFINQLSMKSLGFWWKAWIYEESPTCIKVWYKNVNFVAN